MFAYILQYLNQPLRNQLLTEILKVPASQVDYEFLTFVYSISKEIAYSLSSDLVNESELNIFLKNVYSLLWNLKLPQVYDINLTNTKNQLVNVLVQFNEDYFEIIINQAAECIKDRKDVRGMIVLIHRVICTNKKSPESTLQILARYDVASHVWNAIQDLSLRLEKSECIDENSIIELNDYFSLLYRLICTPINYSIIF